jgi:F-type H+-transporting ATPase subunit epsilon
MSLEQFALAIVTPDGAFLNADVEGVEFPSFVGELGVLPGHVPILVDLAAGELRVYRNGGVDSYAVAGGFVQVRPQAVQIVATFASAGEAEAEIDAACQRAKQALETAAMEDPAVIAAELADLKTELAHLCQEKKQRHK